MDEGFPAEERIQLLKKYPRIDHHFIEAPKVNLEIVPTRSEIAIKRDRHFIETQHFVGSTLVSPATVMGMLLSDLGKDVDRLKLIEHICDAGRLLSDIFYQQSACRKSFITPILNKSLKPILEKIVSDEWLYNKQGKGRSW